MSLACGRTSPPPLGVLACVPSRSRILLKAARCPRSEHLPLEALIPLPVMPLRSICWPRPVMLLPIRSPSALCARPKASGMLLQNLKVSHRCAPVVFSVNRVLCGPLGSRPRWTFMESSVRRVSSKWPPKLGWPSCPGQRPARDPASRLRRNRHTPGRCAHVFKCFEVLHMCIFICFPGFGR